MEVWVSRGSLQGWGGWKQLSEFPFSINLTPVGTQLGFRAKEQGGSMGLQRETRRLQ